MVLQAHTSLLNGYMLIIAGALHIGDRGIVVGREAKLGVGRVLHVSSLRFCHAVMDRLCARLGTVGLFHNSGQSGPDTRDGGLPFVRTQRFALAGAACPELIRSFCPPEI